MGLPLVSDAAGRAAHAAWSSPTAGARDGAGRGVGRGRSIGARAVEVADARAVFVGGVFVGALVFFAGDFFPGDFFAGAFLAADFFALTFGRALIVVFFFVVMRASPLGPPRLDGVDRDADLYRALNPRTPSRSRRRRSFARAVVDTDRSS